MAYNTATESQGGGGIYISSESKISIETSIIELNYAAEGGGMAVNSAKVFMKGVLFFNNTAQGNGGGVIIKGEAAHVLIGKCQFILYITR